MLTKSHYISFLTLCFKVLFINKVRIVCLIIVYDEYKAIVRESPPSFINRIFTSIMVLFSSNTMKVIGSFIYLGFLNKPIKKMALLTRSPWFKWKILKARIL